MTWVPIAFYVVALSAVVVVAVGWKRECSMQSRLTWLRMLNPADRETYRRWARVVAVSYVTMAVCGMIFAVTTARNKATVVVLHASSKSH